MNKHLIFLGNVVFVLALFPYLSPFKTSFDLQPWAFLAGVLFLIFFVIDEWKEGGVKKLVNLFPKPLLLLIAITIYAGTIFLANLIMGNASFMLGLRVFFSYTSVLVFSMVGFLCWKYVNRRVFMVSLGLWLLAAISQLVWGAHIMAGFVSRFSAGGNRGLTALASEPAFFASFCAALIILNEFFYREGRYGVPTYVFIFLILIIEITLSYAGVGLLLMFLLLGAKIIQLIFFKEDKKQKLLTLLFLVITMISFSVFLFNRKFQDTRGGQILQQVVSSQRFLIFSNPSVAYRLFNPILGVYGGVVETYGIGFGVGSVERKQIPDWIASLHGESRNWGGKIEGGLSGVVYELGLVGIFYSLIIFWVLLKSFLSNPKMRVVFLVSACLLFAPLALFSSLAFPLFGFILGIHLSYLKT